MTTQVMIVNMSRGEHAKSVKVEVMQRDQEGKFTNSAEHFVGPQSIMDIYVHSHQSLQVHEMDE